MPWYKLSVHHDGYLPEGFKMDNKCSILVQNATLTLQMTPTAFNYHKNEDNRKINNLLMRRVRFRLSINGRLGRTTK